jgi:hypothetical protein
VNILVSLFSMSPYLLKISAYFRASNGHKGITF